MLTRRSEEKRLALAELSFQARAQLYEVYLGLWLESLAHLYGGRLLPQHKLLVALTACEKELKLAYVNNSVHRERERV